MNLPRTLSSLCPDAQFTTEDDDPTKINWIVPPARVPTLEEITAEDVRLTALDSATTYSNARRKEYPSIGDQLDALYHAGLFPPEMAAAIAAVKAKYPKPE